MKRIFTAARSIAIVLGTTTFFKAYNGSLPTVIVSYPANTGLQLPTGFSSLWWQTIWEDRSATCPYHIQRGVRRV